MRNKWSIMAAAVAAFVAYSPTVIAIPIDGIIDFAGTVAMTPNGPSLLPATTVNTWVLSRALDGAGDYSFVPALGQPVVMSPGWNLTGGFVFHLIGVNNGADNWYYNSSSSIVTFQSGTFINVTSSGTLTGPAGYDPTPGIFNFTVLTPIVLNPETGIYTAAWAGSAGSLNRFQVPDGGSTLILLGAALGAFGLLRKRTAV